jgi:hypothetical protein
MDRGHQDRGMEMCIRVLEERCTRGGGFAYLPGGEPRPDATCWVILALQASGGRREPAERAKDALAKMQRSDGRVCISPRHKDACWPTALAILAWQGSSRHEGRRGKAVRFLLDSQGHRIPDNTVGVTASDCTSEGWPWVAGTHSWVEPTAYALLALRISGYGAHDRAQAAGQLLLHRQLSAGGWNYGNTVVFGQELHPMPETTGMALQALADVAPPSRVEKSLSYLRSQAPSLRTPFAVAWTILGLSTWQEQSSNEHEPLDSIIRKQEQDSPCDTVSLSLLILARCCRRGLVDFLRLVSSKERE